MAEQTTDDLKKCPQCKKAMSKKKRYYRNGRYYCNKNCWKKATEVAPAEAAS